VSGFGDYGLLVGSWNGLTGYADVRITNTLAHDNGNAGIFTYAQSKGAHEDVYVGYSKAYNNFGVTGNNNPSGSGIVVSGVDGAVVERNVAYANGKNNTNGAGPVGIWALRRQRRDDPVINESYSNRPAAGTAVGSTSTVA
jgi:hypothetical protein